MLHRLKVPHTLVLLFGMILLAYVVTWLIPAGSFETITNDSNRDVVVPGTYVETEDAPQLPVWAIFTVIPRGLAEAQDIIFFVFIIGGALAVIRSSGAIDAALSKMLGRFGNQPALLIFLSMLTVAVGASTIGMSEEFIPFTPVLILLCVGMRMDAIVAAGILVIGSGIGYGVAAINPFTVLIAQNLAGLPLISGLGYRLILFIPFFLLGYWHVWRYARGVQKSPDASLMAGIRTSEQESAITDSAFTSRHQAVIAFFLVTLGVLIWGITQRGWYIIELGAAFLLIAIVAGLLAGDSLDKIAKTFTAGASELTGTALLIGFARSIELILQDAEVLHTIVNALATPISQVESWIAASGMLVIQSVFNFFIPSGSGQAYVTMPILAPISDIAGISRQVAVLAYQMGDGFMNMIVPTSYVLMGILGMAGIPYDKWFRFIWPLILQLVVAGCVALAVAIFINYT